jgi:UDP-N-acetylglucosamine:LPS N-acetylglucosamine transferase
MIPKKKKILVLTDHMPWGHRSIAKAIYNYLRTNEEGSNFEVEYAEVKAEVGIAEEVYLFSYRIMPSSNILAYKLGSKKLFKELMKIAEINNLAGLKKEVNRVKPDLIISAYFFHSHTLARWRQKENKKFKLWTIVADPWSINPASFVPEADLNLVYDEVGAKLAKGQGIPKQKIAQTGWWVRPEMYVKYDQKEAREKLGFKDERPIIFIGGGSLGTNSLTRILPNLFLIKEKVGFVINTGTDKLAFNMVEEFIRLYRKIRKDDTVIIKNFGWIDKMAEVLSACDIVFGKAGPNFLFDVVATEKPFVAITHIAGQEDGNLDLIKKKKLGWIKEKNSQISEFLMDYLKNPKHYQEECKKRIRAEAEANQKTLPLILKMAKEL